MNFKGKNIFYDLFTQGKPFPRRIQGPLTLMGYLAGPTILLAPCSHVSPCTLGEYKGCTFEWGMFMGFVACKVTLKLIDYLSPTCCKLNFYAFTHLVNPIFAVCALPCRPALSQGAASAQYMLQWSSLLGNVIVLGQPFWASRHGLETRCQERRKQLIQNINLGNYIIIRWKLQYLSRIK